MDCIHLVQDMENCPAVVNTVMNIHVLQGIYSVAEEMFSVSTRPVLRAVRCLLQIDGHIKIFDVI